MYDVYEFLSSSQRVKEFAMEHECVAVHRIVTMPVRTSIVISPIIEKQMITPTIRKNH